MSILYNCLSTRKHTYLALAEVSAAEVAVAVAAVEAVYVVAAVVAKAVAAASLVVIKKFLKKVRE